MALKRPRYPSISLPAAIERVEAIFNAEHTNAMSNEVAVHHMGYSGLNGASLRVLSALKKYGLLDGRGDNLVVSQDAVTIIADKNVEDQSEREAALTRVLTSDLLFKELWERFKGSSSEINITSYLVKKGFIQKSAKRAAVSYLESIEFVNSELGGYTQINDDDEVIEDNENRYIKQVGTATLKAAPSTILRGEGNIATGMRDIPIPLPGVPWPILRVSLPMTEETWTNLFSLLEAMKPALVEGSKPNSAIEKKGQTNNDGV